MDLEQMRTTPDPDPYWDKCMEVLWRWEKLCAVASLPESSRRDERLDVLHCQFENDLHSFKIFCEFYNVLPVDEVWFSDNLITGGRIDTLKADVKHALCYEEPAKSLLSLLDMII